MASNFPAYVAMKTEEASEVRRYPPGGGAVVPGSLVFYDTTANDMELCGANPALIAGISEVDITALLHEPDGKVPIRIFTDASIVLAMSSATTPAQTHVGDDGEIDNNGGNWRFDPLTAVAPRFTCIDVDITNGIFFVTPLVANLQFAGA